MEIGIGMRGRSGNWEICGRLDEFDSMMSKVMRRSARRVQYHVDLGPPLEIPHPPSLKRPEDEGNRRLGEGWSGGVRSLILVSRADGRMRELRSSMRGELVVGDFGE
jgi:hypothetical protein